MRKAYHWGPRSKENIATLADGLVAFLDWYIANTPYDLSIIEGFRGKELQNKYFNGIGSKKLSNVRWPKGKHNRMVREQPKSDAFHALPAPSILHDKPSYNIWEDTARICRMAGHLQRAAEEYFAIHPKYKIVGLRWGGDWDNDGRTDDQELHDRIHFEAARKGK